MEATWIFTWRKSAQESNLDLQWTLQQYPMKNINAYHKPESKWLNINRFRVLKKLEARHL